MKVPYLMFALLFGGAMGVTGCQSSGNPSATSPNPGVDAEPAAYHDNSSGPYTPGPGDWATDPAQGGISFGGGGAAHGGAGGGHH